MRGATRRSVTDDIVIVDEFVSADECGAILEELEYTFWRPSLTYQLQADGTYKNTLTDTRVSHTAYQDFFSDELIQMLSTIEARLETSFGVDSLDLEWWQATRYPVDGRFDYHLDSGYWDDHHAGDRVRTFLIYLDTPASGGGTHFRGHDVLIEAEAGRLLVWNNLFTDGSPNHSMIHSGTPVRAGCKTILLTWQRQRNFRQAHTASPQEVVGP